MEVFFTWCSEATVPKDLKNLEWAEKEIFTVKGFHALESNEAITFFEQKVADEEMKLTSLPLIGYEFLEQQFLLLNNKKGCRNIMLNVVPKLKKRTKMKLHRP